MAARRPSFPIDFGHEFFSAAAIFLSEEVLRQTTYYIVQRVIICSIALFSVFSFASFLGRRNYARVWHPIDFLHGAYSAYTVMISLAKLLSLLCPFLDPGHLPHKSSVIILIFLSVEGVFHIFSLPRRQDTATAAMNASHETQTLLGTGTASTADPRPLHEKHTATAAMDASSKTLLGIGSTAEPKPTAEHGKNELEKSQNCPPLPLHEKDTATAAIDASSETLLGIGSTLLLNLLLNLNLDRSQNRPPLPLLALHEKDTATAAIDASSETLLGIVLLLNLLLNLNLDRSQNRPPLPLHDKVPKTSTGDSNPEFDT